ncbi:hypothetical protein [Maribacter caenipelagi]|nr:hypothetical protein [Maribacter caenipelagi]
MDVIALSNGINRESRPSSGSYEGGILCNICDNETIGKFETYISNVIKENLAEKEKIICKRVTNVHGLKFIEISNLNYTKTKLFLLSLLWRAGISTREEYKEVDLGMYSEIIRKQIFENKTSEDNNIQITIYKFEDGSNYSSFIGQPRRHKFGHSTAYSIVIIGYLIVYHLRENDISKKAFNNRLKENDSVAIIEVPKNKVEKFVMTYTGMI